MAADSAEYEKASRARYRRREAQEAPRQAGVLHLSRRERRRSLRRQGGFAQEPRAQLLPAVDEAQPTDCSHGLEGRGHRDDGGGQRVGGARPRVQPHQDPPAAVQRPFEGRQELPVHRGDEREVPPRAVHPQGAQRRRALLRAVHERRLGARNASTAPPYLPAHPVWQELDRKGRPATLPLFPPQPVHGAVRGAFGPGCLCQGHPRRSRRFYRASRR